MLKLSEPGWLVVLWRNWNQKVNLMKQLQCFWNCKWRLMVLWNWKKKQVPFLWTENLLSNPFLWYFSFLSYSYFFLGRIHPRANAPMCVEKRFYSCINSVQKGLYSFFRKQIGRGKFFELVVHIFNNVVNYILTILLRYEAILWEIAVDIFEAACKP